MADLTVEMADKALRAAQAKAKELKAPMSIVVVDEAALVIMAARGDGTSPFSLDICRGKAGASVMFKCATKDLAERSRTNPIFMGALTSITGGKVLPTIGAVPITRKGRVIGAIGCGGGTGEQDHQCAEVGAALISD